MSKHDVTIRIGGEGGEGVISAGDLLAELLVNSYFHIMTHRTYPAEIKGGLAMIQVRVADVPLKSHGTEADILFAFNDEAVEAYNDVIKDGGWLFYDPALAPRASEFAKPGQSYAVPLNAISKEASGNFRGKNIVAVGVMAALLGLDKERILAGVAKKFARKGDKVLEANRLCLEAGWKLAVESLPTLTLPTLSPTDEARVVMNGNQALSAGAIAGNIRFIAGYPITPASSVLEYLSANLPKFGGTTMQAEDEIAALGACLGASFGGVRTITATAGPGMCLMAEQIGLAGMTELPVVIVDVQRGGPSTGLPTKQEQGDLNFAVYGTSGDIGKIVLAPMTVEDCFYTAIDAANASDVYATPVVLMSDTTLSVRTQTFPMPDTEKDYYIAPTHATTQELSDGTWKRYGLTETGVSRRTIPGTEGGMHIITGLEHDEMGHAKYTGANHETMSNKRLNKLKRFADLFERPVEVVKPAGAKIGIIGWGSTYGTIQESLAWAKEQGLEVAHCQLRLLYPLPEKQLRSFVEGLDEVLVIEENFSGQLAGLLRSHMGLNVRSYARAMCGPLTPEDILARVKEIGQ